MNRVLVVDRDQSVAARLRGLEPADLVIDTAASLAAADRSIERNRPDVVLLDPSLPDADGYLLLRRWVARGRHPAFVVHRRAASTDEVVAALEAGADGFIVKGCSSRELMARLRVLLREHDDAPTVL